MKNLKEKRRKIVRWIYKTISLTSVVFIFQACYGTDRDFGLDVLIQGVVKSKATAQPIEGIKVSIDLYQYELTDSEGKFNIYVPADSVYKIKFENSKENGEFLPKDTVLRNTTNKFIFLNISLDEK